MKNVCIVTSHSFWDEALGCGALIRSRYEALARVSGKLHVLFITRSQKKCPLPNGRTLHVEGRFTEEHVDAVKRFLDQEAIQTCFFSYIDFSRLAERLSCRTVVETHDVLHLRQQKFAQYGFEAPVQISREAELESLSRFDSIVCINLDEATYLQNCGVHGVSYLPPAATFRPTPGPAGAAVAGLIGSSAIPNVDGLTCAIEALRKLPHVIVAGSLSRNAVLDSSDGIERLGVLPDVAAFYSRINVALSPVRFGGGLKIKVFEALAHGKPVIATSHSIEGFPDGITNVLRVEDDFSLWNADLVREAMAIDPSAISRYFQDHFRPERVDEAIKAIL